jgi:opacity protein-like surface antigen
MKQLLILCLLLCSGLTNAQLFNENLKGTYPTQFYVESQRMGLFRGLVSNDAFLPTPLGERANESSLTAWSQQLGLCLGLSKFVYLDGGVSWMQNGEAYAFSDSNSDSTFNYQTRYRYLALPLQLKLTFGNKLKFYGGLGLVPALYQGYKQNLQWTNALGAKYDDQIKINNAMNSFTISWIGSAGIDLQLDENHRLRLGYLYRKQLNNSYGPYEDYVHKSYGWGFHIGLSKLL